MRPPPTTSRDDLPPKVGGSGGRPKRLVWLLILVAAPLLAAGWLTLARIAEDAVLNQAQARLDAGHWEDAADSLARFHTGRALSSEGRRRAALLYFRLGEDHKAHELLARVPFRKEDSEDQRLREWSARNQRAAALLQKADSAPDPGKRLELLQKAREEVPEAPGILERVVQVELMVMARTPKAVDEAFQRDYTELRTTAPRRAAELRRKVEDLLAKQPGTETR
jgi:hypothetical protein